MGLFRYEPREAPVLETERLVLRGHRLEDAADSAKLWADPRVTRYIGGKPSTRQEAWYRLLRYAGLWPLLGFGYWAVREKVSNSYVGEVGFADLRRTMEPPAEGVPEMGWVLSPDWHGKGLAHQAVTAALEWAERVLKPPRFVCIIHPDNAASLRVASRAGFREVLRTTYEKEPTVLLERPASSGA